MSSVLFKSVDFIKAKAYKNSTSSTQSGKKRTDHWVLEPIFTQNSVKDDLMGWSGGNDIKKQIKLKFSSINDLERYAKKYNISLEIIEPKEKKVIIKSYADNFTTNRGL